MPSKSSIFRVTNEVCVHFFLIRADLHSLATAITSEFRGTPYDDERSTYFMSEKSVFSPCNIKQPVQNDFYGLTSIIFLSQLLLSLTSRENLDG